MDAGSSRQWPHVVDLRDRAKELAGYRATILIGSFAAGTADDLSDVDVIVALADGAFDAAWARRASLRPADALHHWDLRSEETREVAAHNWFTRELVLVECVFATPRGRLRLAEPFAIFDGDPTAAEGFARRAPIARAELDEYNEQLRSAGHLPESHLQYGEFIRALRADRGRRE